MISEENGIFYGVLLFLWIEYLWELYLSLRQHKIYKTKTHMPNELVGILSYDTYNKARIYGQDRNAFSIFKEMISINITTLLIVFLGFEYFWNLSQSALSKLGYPEYNEIPQSLMFLLITNIFNTVINLPISIYHTFVLEEKHGFNKQTLSFFIKDKIKAFIIGQIIMLPLVTGLILIVKNGGPYFFIYLWLFTVAMTFFLMTIYPNLIAPLFDKYTPLPEGELRTRIEQLAAQLKFPLYKLYVVEGSKRSTHSNAYFYGFFKNKRIVLFDTLIKDYKSADEPKTKEESSGKGCDNNEVLAVLGHEMGHWYLNHTVKGLIIMQVNLFLIIWVFAYLFEYEAMYTAFGFSGQRPVLIGLMIVFQFIFTPYNALLNFAMTIMSRYHEFQADAFAAGLGMSTHLRRALIKLNADNLGFPIYDNLYSAWHHSHPPLLERLGALMSSHSD